MASTLTGFRGEGRVYAGSLTEFHGRAVIGMDDCECTDGGCAELEPWDPARRLTVNLGGGVKLEHARSESFVRA